MPPVNFNDIEARIIRSFPYMGKLDLLPISQIPFQMFAYRVTEKENPNTNQRYTSGSGSDGASACGDDNEISDKKLSLSKKSLRVKANKLPGTPKRRSVRPPRITPRGRSIRMSSRKPWRTTGHVSDSELS
ncbi:Hypothetical predicted protein [Olea europaea subsp. europaea]|uniref:Uncharacterized protein n=1 Tax=Olea europaea subsp. europaea TaxID=158383 RepID=A0A8S0TSW0_OLEEU|nr:Hypothetical predicted protein [Olea europaea subsp. europaea]